MVDEGQLLGWVVVAAMIALAALVVMTLDRRDLLRRLDDMDSFRFGPPVKVGNVSAAARHDQFGVDQVHETMLDDYGEALAGLAARLGGVEARANRLGERVVARGDHLSLLNGLKAEVDRCCERLDAVEAYQPPDDIEQWDGQLDKIKLNVLEILELHEARLNAHRTALDLHETRLDGVVSVPGVYGRVDDTETEEAS